MYRNMRTVMCRTCAPKCAQYVHKMCKTYEKGPRPGPSPRPVPRGLCRGRGLGPGPGPFSYVFAFYAQIVHILMRISAHYLHIFVFIPTD